MVTKSLTDFSIQKNTIVKAVDKKVTNGLYDQSLHDSFKPSKFNIEEIELFTKIGDVKIVLISNTSEQRMKFLLERKRSDAPIDKEEFNRRDSKELEIGLGQVMERADIIIENVGLIKEEYARKTESILHNLM